MLRHATTTARNSTSSNITDGRLEVRKYNKTLTAPPRERRRRRPIRSLEAITDGARSGTSLPRSHRDRSSDPHGAPMTGRHHPQVAAR